MNTPHLLHALLTAAAAMMICGCARHNTHVIADEKVKADFEARKAELAAPQYFEIFEQDLPDDQRQALEFLYAYMPAPDITDYPGEYFRQNVELALRARAEMPWGESVPDREFRHFVLPVRVNNENLDGHRQVFYDQLKERVKGMTMQEAILEVNHWCHERVTYEPSDSRTHSPLASVCSGIGRCGEESTFTVAALRSIGIPARQVYTPRWAHTDDNHAWVEVWADGQWHFLGACEPEPKLNIGWFNSAASRGMLMNTRALGRYDGPEEKLLEMPAYTDINVTANYAPVDTVTAIVVDAQGQPIEGATVDFRLYNYAEYYPIAIKTTDHQGRASLVTGHGDLVVWASHNGDYAYQLGGADHGKTVTLTLPQQHQPMQPQTWHIAAPLPGGSAPAVSAEEAAINDRRKAQEDSTRTAYCATFTDKSRGNRATIQAFLDGLPADQRERGKRMLNTLTDKDWTDVTVDVLNDAMLVDAPDSPLHDQYVLSPRIDNEFLTPFRQKFADAFTPQEQAQFRAAPELWAQWVSDNIAADLSWQPATVRMSPWAVWSLRRTDRPSRNVFFVAAARAMGIPARIDPITEKPQYADARGNWRDARIGAGNTADAAADTPKGALRLDYHTNGYLQNPAYYTHFTLSKIVDGRPQLLNYPEDATWRSTFATPQALDTGLYMLVTGQRLANGNVLARNTLFEIHPGQSITVPLALEQSQDEVQVIGNFNSEDKYHDLLADADKSILSTTGRGYYLLGLVADNSEPSNHALRDIAAVKDDFEKYPTKMLLLFPDAQQAANCQLTANLPNNVVIGTDIDGAIRRELVENLNISNPQMPIFVIADSFNRVVYLSNGYNIGMGNSLLQTLFALD